MRRSAFAAVTILLISLPGVAARCDDLAQAVSDSVGYAVVIPLGLTVFGGEEEERTGRRMLDATIVAAAAAEGLKAITNESRPGNPGADDGFPSAHSAIAWALAESAAQIHHDARPYAYTYAAAVTWSRIDLDRHTPVQALAGAALGYGVARLSANSSDGLLFGLVVDDSPPKPGSRLMLRPSYNAQSPGGPEWQVRVWEVGW